MRRPRSKLEVSTFPFLAVLLCVMGSLLLLLFIMDRRAKVAAQYRVTEELQARKARSKAEEDARQTEWETAKLALHQSLLAQQDQLLADSKGLQQNLNGASKNLSLVQARHVGLEQQVKGEADKIGVIQLEIEARRADLKDASKKETMSKGELIAAARELAELEQAFRQLKALKAQDHQTYSVVPYRGKRGDARPPIYVECIRDGVIFHPDKKVLTGLHLTPSSLRGEVERQAGPLAIQKAVEKGKPLSEEQKGPYVLFLVRPAGIGNYYRAQSALQGYQLDFGYELVDEGWVLDFSGNRYAKTAPPSKPGIADTRIEPVFTPLPPLFTGNGAPQLGDPLAPPGNGTSTTPGVGGSRYQPPSLTPPTGFGPPTFPVQTPGSGSGAGGPSVGTDTGLGTAPAFVPIGKAPPLFPSISNAERTRYPNGFGGGSPNSSTPGNNGSEQKPSTGLPGNNSGQQPPTGSPGNTGTGQQPPTGSPGNTGTGQQPATAPGGNGGSPGDPQGESAGPGVRPFSAFGNDNAKKPMPAPPLSRMLGNKDFVITIDCHGDYLTVAPGSLTFRWTASNLKDTDEALVQSVKNLIARRQASVQPGEPPYRPLIRLCVHSDGRNTLYRAYPLLDRVGVPMTRENVSE